MQFHLIVMVLAEYSSSYSLFALSYHVGNIYFDLPQTQQHFQIIVELAHAHPTMSCIHLVGSGWDVLHAASCVYMHI